jgi:hypothetical protein
MNDNKYLVILKSFFSWKFNFTDWTTFPLLFDPDRLAGKEK